MWSKTYNVAGNDQGYALVEVDDGGYVIAGMTDSNNGDACLVKTDDAGNLLWNYTYGGSLWDYPYSLAKTADGGYALAGVTNSVSRSIYDDGWLVKTNASGGMLWDKSYGSFIYDGFYSVATTPDGGFILAGYTSIDFRGYWDAWLVKTDASGTQQWDKRYGDSGSASDWARCVVPTPDGGYVVGGHNGMGYAWLFKIDASGNTLWSKTYGSYNDEVYAVVVAEDGGYVCAGVNGGGSTGMGNTGDFWLAKIDALGQNQWSRTYPREGADYAYALTKTKDGGYALAGVANYTAWEDIGGPGRYSYTGDVCLIKTDAAGIAQWNQIFNLSSGIDSARGLVATQDGGYALAGSSGVTQGVGGKLLLMKTDEYGVVPEVPPVLVMALALALATPIFLSKKKLMHS